MTDAERDAREAEMNAAAQRWVEGEAHLSALELTRRWYAQARRYGSDWVRALQRARGWKPCPSEKRI